MKPFRYILELDAFVLTEDYQHIASYLGIKGWKQYAWIGRLFTLDNNYGEHWMDNWELREIKASKAEALGYDELELLIINPSRLQNEKDGPCHSEEIRKLFWTNVLDLLVLSPAMIIAKARLQNGHNKYLPDSYIKDLEDRIESLF
uniref:Uncharacterized protein n=1 Tax=Roseihalotalea indica TaxID=2867963 RepID=A0AA49GN27_9BACT|nr:hypothetical protein K4G66_01275 [Tunicatimonas sp. TK19036]